MNGERLYLIDDPEMGIVAETDPEVIARHKRRYEWAADRLQEMYVTSVVDAGCGSGYGSTILRVDNYIGMDVDEVAIRYAERHYPEDPFIQGSIVDAAKHAWPRCPVVCLEAMEHTSEAEQMRFIDCAGDGDITLVLALPVRLLANNLPPTTNPHHVYEPLVDDLASWLLEAGYTPTITLERYESTYGPATQALVVARPT